MGFAPRPRLRFGDGDVFQLRIELAGISPPVWRRVAMSGRASLHELHAIIQTVMGHTEELGYHIDIDGVTFFDPDEEPDRSQSADQVSLESLGLHAGERLVHVAEHHGDPWQHIVTVEQITPRLIGQRVPACLAAGRAAPPDDCASVDEYCEILQAKHRDDHYALAWTQWLPENFDPEFADIVAVNAALGRISRGRPAA